MSETRPVAIFADEIRVGMLIEHPIRALARRARVTRVRSDSQNVAIIGEYEDGSPFTYECGVNLAWLCLEAPVTVETVGQDD